jgi:hypothetical protein
MAHFAKLGLNYNQNKVLEVVVIDNDKMTGEDGIESEQLGIDFLEKLTGYPYWVQTSYNDNIRKNFAGEGFTYDKDRDAFIPHKPYPSWFLNEDTCRYEPPVPVPEGEGVRYTWNEESQTWDLQ